MANMISFGRYLLLCDLSSYYSRTPESEPVILSQCYAILIVSRFKACCIVRMISGTSAKDFRNMQLKIEINGNLLGLLYLIFNIDFQIINV